MFSPKTGWVKALLKGLDKRRLALLIVTAIFLLCAIVDIVQRVKAIFFH